MNKLEQSMVDILKQLRDQHHVSGVKAEFEAEGTRTEELMRLKEISLGANVSLTLKIGGAEAVRDMYDARSIGVDHLLAPMVESPFQLQKYIRAVEDVFPADERKNIDFLINVETIGTTELFEEMLQIPEISKLHGIVVGRGDLVESMGYDRKAVDNDRSFEVTQKILTRAKEAGMTTVVGGGVSAASLDFLRRLAPGCLDRYETRKVCFDCPAALNDKADRGIEMALEFELYWLSNKRDYYRSIAEEDLKRISVLEQRLKKSVL
jgi:hypothetical protein